MFVLIIWNSCPVRAWCVTPSICNASPSRPIHWHVTLPLKYHLPIRQQGSEWKVTFTVDWLIHSKFDSKGSVPLKDDQNTTEFMHNQSLHNWERVRSKLFFFFFFFFLKIGGFFFVFFNFFFFFIYLFYFIYLFFCQDPCFEFPLSALPQRTPLLFGSSISTKHKAKSQWREQKQQRKNRTNLPLYNLKCSGLKAFL